MIQVSFYKNTFETNGVTTPLSSILKAIKGGKWKTKIEELRSESDVKSRDKLKQALPAFTTSGLFGDSREDRACLEPSGLIALDIDYDEPHFRSLLEEDPYTYCAFRSASAKGWCVLIKISRASDPEHHKNVARALSTYYRDFYGIKVDPTFKNLGRLRYVSFDPELFGNQKSSIWTKTEEVQKPKEGSLSYENSDMPTGLRLHKMLFMFTNEAGAFGTTASRHDYVYKFFVWANRAGIPQPEALTYALSNFQIPERNYRSEHRRSAMHVYESSAHEWSTKVPNLFFNPEDVKNFPQDKKFILKWLIEKKIKSIEDYSKREGASQKYIDMQSNEVEILIEIHKLI